MEKRKLLLTLSSDSDLGNLSPSPLLIPSRCSLCLLFFLRFLHSFALLELNFDASEELSKSSPSPPIPLKSLEAADAAATAYLRQSQVLFRTYNFENSWLRYKCCHFILLTICENYAFWSFHCVSLQESLLKNNTVLNSIKRYASLCIRARKVWFGIFPGEVCFVLFLKLCWD